MTHTDLTSDPPEESLGLNEAPGQNHYRAYVGPPEDYDLVGAMTFGLLTTLGLRQQHRVLDIGCGSLRVGRLLLPYLNRGCYAGLEPNAWLVSDGIRREIGQDQVLIKQPRFIYEDNADRLVSEGSTYDFILAQSIFSHCGPDLLESWVSQVSNLLTDEGTLVATFIESEVDNPDSGWIYPGCVSYRRSTMSSLSRQHGLDFVMLDWRHPRQNWMLMAKPGFDADHFSGQSPGWNHAFERIDARRQR